MCGLIDAAIRRGRSYANEAFNVAMCELCHARLKMQWDRHDEAREVCTYLNLEKLFNGRPLEMHCMSVRLSMILSLQGIYFEHLDLFQVLNQAAMRLRPAIYSSPPSDALLLRAMLSEILTVQADLCMDDFMSRSLGGQPLLKGKDTHRIISDALAHFEDAFKNLQCLGNFEEDASNLLTPPGIHKLHDAVPLRDTTLRDTESCQDYTKAGALSSMDTDNLSQLEIADFAADILMGLSAANIASTNWQAAQAACQRALCIRRRIYGDCSVHVALCHEKLGEIYQGLAWAGLLEVAESGASAEVCESSRPQTPAFPPTILVSRG